ncbi:hypothetical protein [Bacillus sp. NPDC094106]|uniref:hypothetical protein n=1 Tax=Bacillus sp. NPDC094106 TaxID=3363949 RepID=UPI0037F7A6CE
METKRVNDFINNVIGSDEFQKLQQEVVNQMFNKMKDFPFESDDDVRLVSSRLRDGFYLGVNYELTRKMIALIGKKERKGV